MASLASARNCDIGPIAVHNRSMTKSPLAPAFRLSRSLVLVVCLVNLGCGDEGEASADQTPDAAAESVSVGSFCDAYEEACGFGRETTFSDREDCEDDFADKFSEARRRCASEHLDQAAVDPDGHCEAAKGDDVCR